MMLLKVAKAVCARGARLLESTRRRLQTFEDRHAAEAYYRVAVRHDIENRFRTMDARTRWAATDWMARNQAALSEEMN